MRGKLCDPRLGTDRLRLIPACAGKTTYSPERCRELRAHPRVCGENIFIAVAPAVIAGSSPRVRGKPPGVGRAITVFGLIPACAGKTKNPRKPRAGLPAHPRVCGENLPTIIQAFLDAGSSPRVRGKPPDDHSGIFGCGLIPACAGKTRWEGRLNWRMRAHPRVCGENVPMREATAHMMGSSPRVRGKLLVALPADYAPGLIPACAGKTAENSTCRPLP